MQGHWTCAKLCTGLLVKVQPEFPKTCVPELEPVLALMAVIDGYKLPGGEICMRVGIIQMAVTLGDKKANKKSVAEKVRLAMQGDCPPQAIVLPELWSTGYDLEHAQNLATLCGEDEADFLGSLAQKYHVAFVGGSVFALDDGGIFNRAQVIDEHGNYTGWYDKIHLFRPMQEERFLSAGAKASPFMLQGSLCACIICYDLRFCELPRKLALAGAEVLFVSAEWPAVRIEHWAVLIRARAIENQMFVVACNQCANTRQERFGGTSMIVAPDGTILAQAQGKETLLCAKLDTAFARTVRENIPVFADRIPHAYIR